VAAARFSRGVPIEAVEVSAYEIPTDAPESDGTLAWAKTTLVVVEAAAGGVRGLGYTYADTATAKLVESRLAALVCGKDALDIPRAFEAMVRSIRNLGRPGIASMAISAVDAALWDLKARLLELPLARLLGAVRDAVPVYGSGGFASYSLERIEEQLAGWVGSGITAVKLKVGRDPGADLERVRIAREAIGPGARLFVDANGAYERKEALAAAEAFAGRGVAWFEEPVSSDDLEGLRLLRDRAPSGMEIAAGEYGYDLPYFRRMLEAGAVDVLQIDGSRCGGITGFLKAAALAEARSIPVSAHTAPSLHAHVCCGIARLRPLEYFHDHARIERLLFEGALVPEKGALRPDAGRAGMGLELKRADARKYAA
jgi:L-alanine-DL-glutamate epimerase-like enolase superfamily enzyme